MKQSAKVAASLRRRIASAKPSGPNPKHEARTPGSQNRNKGASARESRR